MKISGDMVFEVISKLSDFDRVSVRGVSKEFNGISRELGFSSDAAREMSDAFERRQESEESCRRYRFLVDCHAFARRRGGARAQRSREWSLSNVEYRKIKNAFLVDRICPPLSKFVSASTPDIGNIPAAISALQLSGTASDISWLPLDKMSHLISVGRDDSNRAVVVLKSHASKSGTAEQGFLEKTILAYQEHELAQEGWVMGFIDHGRWIKFMGRGSFDYLKTILLSHYGDWEE